MMLPTRADIVAMTEWGGRAVVGEVVVVVGEGKEGRGVDLRGRKGKRCFMSRRGPRVLTAKVERVVSGEIWEGERSGGKGRMPGTRKPRWR